MRKIATIITILTTGIALGACSQQPLPEPVMEKVTTTAPSATTTSEHVSLFDVIERERVQHNSDESHNGVHVRVVGSFVPADSAHNGYIAWREYEVIDASGNVVQCFGVEHDTSSTPVIDCNFPAPR